MNLINSITQYWSRYELTMEIVLYLSIFLVSLLTIYLSTKSKRLLLLSALAFIVSAISNLIGIFIVNTIITTDITEIFRMIPVLTSILLVSNLGILIGFYIHKSSNKNFNLKSIIREYYKDSIKQTIFLLLLGLSTIPFLSIETEAIVSISILSTITAIWFTYWVSKYILK